MPELNEQEEQMLMEDNKWLPVHITEQMIDNLIVSSHFATMGRKTMVCCLTLKNGFEVIGTSSCVVEQQFDADIAMRLAEKNAKEQIWQLQGYLLQHFRAIEDNKIKKENSFGN